MTTERIDTLIIGGGQAGLTMSHMLRQRERAHIVLERDRIGVRWRTERWNGLRFQFPNWSVSLPDFPFAHEHPDGFASAPEIVAYLTAYAEFVKAPVRTGVAVTALRTTGDQSRFIADTTEGTIEAANVVVATGPYQRALMPDIDLADVKQLHASHYRAPQHLPAGAVLVVGSGASGVQIAEELRRAGRRVYLSVGHHRRMPRRYRGRDFTWWLRAMGVDQTPVERRGPSLGSALITGAYGGHTIDLRRFAAEGITLLGRFDGADGCIMEFADDLAECLAKGDAAYLDFLGTIDEHIVRQGLDLPAEPSARDQLPDPTCVVEPMRRLDLRAAGVSSVIWSTGYTVDFGWIDLPIFDADGEPKHHHGVTEVRGLYFLGLQWLSKMTSSFLSGVGDDAARLADHLVAHRRRGA